MEEVDGTDGSDREKLTRSAGVVGFLTLVSRITGYVRDMAVAYFFGAAAETDAFWVAYRIPNLLRRLFAEGSLTISFIPVFTEYLETKSEEEAKKVADSVFTLLFIILIFVSIAGIVFSPYIIKLFASGFTGDTFDLAVYLNRVMFPFIFFVSLSALSMGILNSLKHFFAPAFSPVIFNICTILAIVLVSQRLDIPILAAAIGVIIGGVVQLVFQFPFLRSRSFLFGFTQALRHSAVKRIGLLMAPQLFGLAVYNLNIIVNTQYASYMPRGTVSYLWFAERLIEFPLGIIAVSIATVLLPNLSSYASRGEDEKFRDSYGFTLRLMLFVVVPSLVGLIVLREPICNLLYQRGEFMYEATVKTSEALLGYAIGLWAVGGIRITAPAFYAMQDTKTPVIAAFFAFLINAALGYVLGFMFGLKHTGLALASSISSIFNFLLLFVILNKRMGWIEIRRTLLFCLKTVAVAVVMGALAWELSTFGVWSEANISLDKISIFLLSVAAPAVFYFGMSKLLGMEEADYLFKTIRSRKPGREIE